jgi:hypothetical protein
VLAALKEHDPGRLADNAEREARLDAALHAVLRMW